MTRELEVELELVSVVEGGWEQSLYGEQSEITREVELELVLLVSAVSHGRQLGAVVGKQSEMVPGGDVTVGVIAVVGLEVMGCSFG